jgi:hypothetical protein
MTMSVTAQDALPAVGEYYLSGVMEVGSGIKLNPDKTFDFFFSYGAVDRAGKGFWEQRGDSIILNSARKPPLDFRLVQTKSTGEQQITIKIVDENPQVISHILVGLQCGDSVYRGETDDSGSVVFPGHEGLSHLSLMHGYWPDRYSVFSVKGQENYFTFKIESWIVDVEFNNIILILGKQGLTGPHPLLKKEQYLYTRKE